MIFFIEVGLLDKLLLRKNVQERRGSRSSAQWGEEASFFDIPKRIVCR